MSGTPDLGARLAHAIGNALRRARLERGLTLREVADALDDHGPVISRTEAGHVLPKLTTLVLHARAVGLTLSEIAAIVDAEVA